MMKNYLIISFLIIFLLSIFLFNISCNTNKDLEIKVVGNDKDKNGCIGSAGYVWSNALNDCVRFFEVGIVYEPIVKDIGNKSTYISNVFVIYSKDKSFAELFIGDRKEPVLLEKRKNIKNNDESYFNKKEDIELLNTENNSYIIIRDDIKYFKKI